MIVRISLVMAGMLRQKTEISISDLYTESRASSYGLPVIK